MHYFRLQRHPRPQPSLYPPPVIPTPQDWPSSMPGGFPDDDDTSDAQNSREPFLPSVLDVLVSKAMLVKGLGLPLEIVDRVIEFAEYWPHTSAVIDHGPEGKSTAHGSSSSEDKFILRTLPLGFIKQVHPEPDRYKTEAAKVLRLSREQSPEQFNKWIGSPYSLLSHPCRKIVFTIVSHDQGWGGEPGHAHTHKGSWTWFDVGLERVDASGECGDHCPDHAPKTKSKPRPHISPCAMRPIVPAVLGEPNEKPRLEHTVAPPPQYKIQGNKTATRTFETHKIEWRADDDTHSDSPQAQLLREIGRGEATANGDFVRNLKLGDVVTVWARARFPGWSNYLRYMKVDVYWAI